MFSGSTFEKLAEKDSALKKKAEAEVNAPPKL
jgi:hypothetical protein